MNIFAADEVACESLYWNKSVGIQAAARLWVDFAATALLEDLHVFRLQKSTVKKISDGVLGSYNTL